MIGQKVSSGQRQPTIRVSLSTSSKSPVSTPVSEETESAADYLQKNSEVENVSKNPSVSFSEHGIPSEDNHSARSVSSSVVP